jgi:hypothetical protein
MAVPLARVLLGLLGLQLLLGGAALVARLQPAALSSEAMSLAVFVAHRLVASVILGVAVVLALRVWTPAVRSAASSAGAAGATSWGEVRTGGEAPLRGNAPLPETTPLRGI